jgi:hypothetical protein
MKYYENFELTTEEKAEAEMLISEDRKTELRKLTHHAGLRHETYYLINKQFQREIARCRTSFQQQTRRLSKCTNDK